MGQLAEDILFILIPIYATIVMIYGIYVIFFNRQITVEYKMVAVAVAFIVFICFIIMEKKFRNEPK